MACDTLTRGRKEPCKDVVGGLRNVYFIEYSDANKSITFDSADNTLVKTLGTDASNEVDGHKYELKGNSSFEQNITSSRENGTTFYTQTLTLQLQYYDRATSEEIKLLAVSRPHIVVVDADDNHLLVGRVNGAELTTGNFTVGANMGDFNGFNLTFEALETRPPDFVTGSVVTGAASSTQISTFPTS